MTVNLRITHATENMTILELITCKQAGIDFCLVLPYSRLDNVPRTELLQNRNILWKPVFPTSCSRFDGLTEHTKIRYYAHVFCCYSKAFRLYLGHQFYSQCKRCRQLLKGVAHDLWTNTLKYLVFKCLQERIQFAFDDVSITWEFNQRTRKSQQIDI